MFIKNFKVELFMFKDRKDIDLQRILTVLNRVKSNYRV